MFTAMLCAQKREVKVRFGWGERVGARNAAENRTDYFAPGSSTNCASAAAMSMKTPPAITA